MLFFGAFTGANVLRNDPPDRYVFNYRASYVEETEAVVRYLVKIRRIPTRQIAVFAQQDSYGDAGFAGVAKAFRGLGANDGAILRVGYKRNTVDVDEAVNTLKAQKTPIKAVVMVGAYRACAKFIEKTRDAIPGLTYTNVSFVGSTALADELMLLGARYASGVIVTQVVPAVSGYSSVVLEYKNALAKYFPGEAPDYVSLEGYVAATVLIQALRKVGPQLDTEKLVDTLEAMRELDLGLGTKLGYGRAEHQASHKIWGTAIRRPFATPPNTSRPYGRVRPGHMHFEGLRDYTSAGSTASSYSFLKRAISSAAGTTLPIPPMPWPLPQISFQAFGLLRSPEASVPKLILEGSEVGSSSGLRPAFTIDGFR
jgi:branched-chain amino acid transport system substrate-binding protein